MISVEEINLNMLRGELQSWPINPGLPTRRAQLWQYGPPKAIRGPISTDGFSLPTQRMKLLPTGKQLSWYATLMLLHRMSNFGVN